MTSERTAVSTDTAGVLRLFAVQQVQGEAGQGKLSEVQEAGVAAKGPEEDE